MDPMGNETRSENDQAGRRVHLIENFIASAPEVARVTEFVWHPNGQLDRLILVNAETGDQVTRWIFGTTLAESAIASNHLLRTKIYPESDDRRHWRRRAPIAGEDHHYGYDGVTRHITRDVGGITLHTYYNDQWRPLEERRDDQTYAFVQYLWGARHRDDLARRDRIVGAGTSLNETRYVLMDYFSPAAITDASGAVTERYAFGAFGFRTIMAPNFSYIASSECDFDFAFQGQFLDGESGMLNYGYRYYAPGLGRWISKDPIGEVGGANLYEIVVNNCVNEVDHLGLIRCGPAPARNMFAEQADYDEQKCLWDKCQKTPGQNYDQIPCDELEDCGKETKERIKEGRARTEFWDNCGQTSLSIATLGSGSMVSAPFRAGALAVGTGSALKEGATVARNKFLGKSVNYLETTRKVCTSAAVGGIAGVFSWNSNLTNSLRGLFGG